MDRYLSHKYFLILNANYQQYIPLTVNLKTKPWPFDLPQEIIQYIMSLIYNLTYVRAFAGQKSTTLIINKRIVNLNDTIFDRRIADRLNKEHYMNVKKIVHSVSYLLILSCDNKVYMYGGFYSKNENISGMFIIDNIKDISANECYCTYITNSCELYIQGSEIPVAYFDHQINYISYPVRSDLINVKQIVCHEDKMIVLFNDNKVVDLHNPSQHLNLPPIKEIIGGLANTIAISYDNEVYGWGYNHDGQIPNTDQSQNIPITKFDINNVKSVRCCFHSTFVLTNNGDVYSCGDDSCGQLGLGPCDFFHYTKNDTTCKLRTKLFKIDLPAIDSIHCGSNHVIAITISGEIYGWGDPLRLKLPGSRQSLPIKINL